MSAGALMSPNMNHRTVMRMKAVRGPGNIGPLPRGQKVVPRAKRMALKKKGR